MDTIYPLCNIFDYCVVIEYYLYSRIITKSLINHMLCINVDCFTSFAMTKSEGRHCEERSDVAIYSGLHNRWIEQARLFIQTLASTNFNHGSIYHEKHIYKFNNETENFTCFRCLHH